MSEGEATATTITPIGLMRYDDAAMTLLRCCSLDYRTVRNMREEIIPSLRRADTYSAAEIDAAVAEFEARVKSANLNVR